MERVTAVAFATIAAATGACLADAGSLTPVYGAPGVAFDAGFTDSVPTDARAADASKSLDAASEGDHASDSDASLADSGEGAADALLD